MRMLANIYIHMYSYEKKEENTSVSQLFKLTYLNISLSNLSICTM